MPRLQYTARTELGEIIENIQIARSLNKSETLAYLIDLARNNPDHPIHDFKGEQEVNCTLEIKEKDYANYLKYRQKHRITKKNKFFRDALKRGASYYKDNNP